MEGVLPYLQGNHPKHPYIGLMKRRGINKREIGSRPRGSHRKQKSQAEIAGSKFTTVKHNRDIDIQEKLV